MASSKRGQVWPTHGSAVEARNQSAEGVNSIEMQSALLLELVMNGKFTREELIYRLSIMNQKANHVLRILEEQGAPTRPRLRPDWMK